MVDAIHSKCIDLHHEGSSPSLLNKKNKQGCLKYKIEKVNI